MSRDLTDVEQEYLNLDDDCARLRKFIAERRAGAAEAGFSAETRAACVYDADRAEVELAARAERMKELEPQFKVDRAKRHAKDLEEARAGFGAGQYQPADDNLGNDAEEDWDMQNS